MFGRRFYDPQYEDGNVNDGLLHGGGCRGPFGPPTRAATFEQNATTVVIPDAADPVEIYYDPIKPCPQKFHPTKGVCFRDSVGHRLV